MTIQNPIKYTSRTFNTILNDINSDSELADKPNWFKRIWAGVGDIFSMWINAYVNNVLLRTAFTRQAVSDLLELIDYQIGNHTTSSGKGLFYVDTSLGSGIFPFLVSKADLIGFSQGNLSVSSKRFEARADVNFTDVNDTFTATPGTDILTLSTDLEYTGHLVHLSTTGTLPTPLQASTDYYVIYVSATTIKLAETLEDAIAGNVIDITNTGSGTHTIRLFSKTTDMYQQETLAAFVSLGTSDGVTEWQEFDLPDKLVLSDQLTIRINAITWTKVTTFVNSTSSSKHYIVIKKSDNQFAVRFGNGSYGEIPGEFDIEALYSFGGGSDSNISSLNRLTIYSGQDSNLTGITNATVFTGGDNEESAESAKRIGPILLKTRDRFITVEDGEGLALAFGGLALVTINKNVYGLLSCQVLGIANGGGNPSSGLKTSIEDHLIDRSVLESIDVRFDDATITATAVTSAAKILPGYTWANVQPFFELAYLLFLSETGQEIKTKFEDEGIDEAVTLINTIFSKTFDSNDNAQITKLIENLTPRDFGDTINQSDVFGYIDGFVDGVDFITISVFGTGFPQVQDSDEITTDGTLTLTEIP
jgi:hypothetical protein